MIKVEVKDAKVNEETRTWPDKRTGEVKQGQFREQSAWAYLIGRDGPEPHPTKIKIGLDKNAAAFAPGTYQLAPESLFVDRYGKLTMGRVSLRPLSASVKAAA